MHALTAAHRSLPLGTRVLVTNVKNDRSVEVRINDRGPYRPRTDPGPVLCGRAESWVRSPTGRSG